MSEIGKNLIVISGPSGCGKDTVVKYILSHDDRFALSVSATTRAKRPSVTNFSQTTKHSATQRPKT